MWILWQNTVLRKEYSDMCRKPKKGEIVMSNAGSTEQLRVSRIEQINGAPALTVDGRPIPMMSYQWGLGNRIDNDPAHDTKWMLENVVKADTELFFNWFWIDDPEKFDTYYDKFIEQMKLLTDIRPDALVIPWININAYDAFPEKYPGDVIYFDDGSNNAWTRSRDGQLSRPDGPRYTFASTAWKREVAGQLREFIRRLNKSDYVKNIVGYFFFPRDFEFSYFFEFDTLNRCIDFSPAMQQAFRNYLVEKYRGDVRLLRKAWKDDAVTFETAQIPKLEKRITGDFGYFRDPALSMQVYDYVACHNEANVDAFIYFSQVCKEETDGKQVVGAFYGYLMNQDLQMGGQTQIKKALNCPYIDIMAAPYTYENRCVGNFASMRMLIKSLNKHGKFYFAESDAFMSDSNRWSKVGHNYPDQTFEEDRAILKRDFVYPLCEGTHCWWIDWSSGVSEYLEEGHLPLLRQITQISKESFGHPRGPVSDIAALLDQESLHVPACNSRDHDHRETTTNAIQLMQHSLDRFRVDELPRIGSPVDFYETDDVLDGEGHSYRMYIFMNQYVATPQERERIEKYLKKDGNVLVWMYGAGLINPDADEMLSLKNAEALTGFKLGCEMRETRCIMTANTCELLPSVKEGEKLSDYLRDRINRQFTQEEIDSGRIGTAIPPFPWPEPNLVNPLIYVDDPEAIAVAHFDDGGKVEMAIRQFEDWTSVYVGAPGLQSHVLRDLAKLAKAHLFVDGDEIVYANEGYVAIHTDQAGERTVHLKQAADVEEVFEKRSVGKNVMEFTEHIPGHETRLYKLN